MNRPSTPDRPDSPGLSAGSLWTLRVLALVGFAIAAVLLGHHVAAEWLQRSATVPFCGEVGWFDCESVLESRWSRWLGLPVAAPAVPVYLLLLQTLEATAPAARPPGGPRPILCIVGQSLAGAPG